MSTESVPAGSPAGASGVGAIDVDLGMVQERERVVAVAVARAAAEMTADALDDVLGVVRDSLGLEKHERHRWRSAHHALSARGRGLPVVVGSFASPGTRSNDHGEDHGRAPGTTLTCGACESDGRGHGSDVGRARGVVLALGGEIGVGTIPGLKGLLADVRQQRPAELIVELSAMPTDTDQQLARHLARLLGRLRIWCLLDGTRLEVRHPPPAVAGALYDRDAPRGPTGIRRAGGAANGACH